MKMYDDKLLVSKDRLMELINSFADVPIELPCDYCVAAGHTCGDSKTCEKAIYDYVADIERGSDESSKKS